MFDVLRRNIYDRDMMSVEATFGTVEEANRRVYHLTVTSGGGGSFYGVEPRKTEK